MFLSGEGLHLIEQEADKKVRIMTENNSDTKRIVLTEQDLHCLARLLQGCLYTDGGIFGCCRYCKYQEGCSGDAGKGKTYFTKMVAGKLQKITGVYLGINTCNLKEKLLMSSFRSTRKLCAEEPEKSTAEGQANFI